MSTYQLTNDVRERFTPIIRAYLDKMEDPTGDKLCFLHDSEFYIDLTGTGISPYQLRMLLEEEFGYEFVAQDQNGWQMDYWMYFRRKDGRKFPSGCESLVAGGCGISFTLTLEIWQ